MAVNQLTNNLARAMTFQRQSTKYNETEIRQLMDFIILSFELRAVIVMIASIVEAST